MTVQPGLCLTWSETQIVGFLITGSYAYILFQELLKVMYMDPALDHLCDVDYNPCKLQFNTDLIAK